MHLIENKYTIEINYCLIEIYYVCVSVRKQTLMLKFVFVEDKKRPLIELTMW